MITSSTFPPHTEKALPSLEINISITKYYAPGFPVHSYTVSGMQFKNIKKHEEPGECVQNSRENTFSYTYRWFRYLNY